MKDCSSTWKSSSPLSLSICKSLVFRWTFNGNCWCGTPLASTFNWVFPWIKSRLKHLMGEFSLRSNVSTFWTNLAKTNGIWIPAKSIIELNNLIGNKWIMIVPLQCNRTHTFFFSSIRDHVDKASFINDSKTKHPISRFMIDVYI